ncbi:MAG: hypothetical protein IH975_06735 [Nitrospinae bacterium]|nr:hypothetical protein [Nitrospinota bacterium]
MKVKQTRKVSFRVAPPVKEFLEAAAEYSDLTLADFVRDCLNHLLTGDLRQLPEFFTAAEEPIGGFWALDSVKEYERFVDEVLGE